MDVLDLEGWAVGVAALWGYHQNVDVASGYISTTCNSAIATNNRRRAEPFRGIATARQEQSLLAMTYCKNHYKQSISTTSAEVSKIEVHKLIING